MKQFRCPAAGIAEEAVQHGEPMVPRSDIVAAFDFKIREESPHIVRAKVGQRQLADRAAGRLGQKEEEEPDAIAVASDGCLGESLLGFEVMLEELVNQTTDGRHGWPPLDIGAAKRSKRWPAVSMRSAVIVR